MMDDYETDDIEADDIEDFSIEQLAELEDLKRLEADRRARVAQFVNDMERPERVLAMSDDDDNGETSDNTDKAEETDTKDLTDGDGTFTPETATETADTEGGDGSTSKIKLDIFSFLELEKIPDWYNAILINTTEFGHDRFSKIEDLIEERKQNYAIMSTSTTLTDEQRIYYRQRYDVLDKAIAERVEGRKTIAERMEFPQPMKQKFGEAFKGWIETLNIRYELSPGVLLLIMFVASLIYASTVVFITQKQYQKV